MVIRIAILFLLLAGAARAETLRILVPEAAPVAGEMVKVTVRGEYTSFITLEKLTFPSSDAYDWIQVARDQWREERIDGRTVRVFERRVAVYPRRAGALTIGPVVHELTVMGGPKGREPRPVTAEAVTLTVAPFPAEHPPLAARNLTVEDSLSALPGELRDGETLVRRVVIRAEGALPQQLPPRPSMREPWLITFAAPEIRETRPTPDGPVTTVTWEWNLRPRTGEPGVLPAVEIPWFDTVARQMRRAEIPAIPFGYVSFGENLGGADSLPDSQVQAATIAVGLGLLVGVAGAATGRTRRRWGDVVRALRRLSPIDPTRWAVRRAARSGDLVALRRAAERHLRRRRDLGLPTTGRETAALDAALFGRTGGTADPAALAAAILRRR